MSDTIPEVIFDHQTENQVLRETRRCVMCGQTSLVAVDAERWHRWAVLGEHVQDVWPKASPDERELLITGTHPACWRELFGPISPFDQVVALLVDLVDHVDDCDDVDAAIAKVAARIVAVFDGGEEE